jgi:outer membrane protein assembly factor BamB
MLNINNEVLLTGFSGGKFGILALANGGLIWEATLSPPRGYSEIERLSDITSKPSLLGQRMCVVSYQGKIGCGDVKTSAIAWAKDFSSFTGVAQSPDRVFAANEKSSVFAFQASNGQELWRNESLVWRDVSEPLAVGKVLLYGDSQGYLHTLSQDNGTFLARLRVDSSPIVAGPVAVGGVIVVQTRGGTLAAYRP